MNCKKNRMLLHLRREGELSGRQAKSLERHLEQCPECAAVLERLARLEETVLQGRKNSPKPINPEMLTGRIMNAVARINMHGHSERVPVSGTSEESLGGIYTRPGTPRYGGRTPGRFWGSSGIRFGLAAAVALVVGAFFIQESMILSRISRLEGRMAVISTNQAAPVSLRNALQPVEGIDGIRRISLTQSAAQEEWVRIRKTDLTRLIRIVQKQHPEIRTLDEALSVDQETMLRILRENSGIVRQLIQSS
jgi:hypothetical protein